MKKFIAIVLSAVMMVSLFAGCSGNTNEPAATKEPETKATEAPTAAPTEAPTPAPTEEPKPTEEPTPTPVKVEKLDMDAIITDLSEDVPIDAFTKSSSMFEYINGDAYATIVGGSGAYVSLRLYDVRFIDDGTGAVSSEPQDRTLADGTKYNFYALKYRLTEGAEWNGINHKICSWETNIISSPTDIIEYSTKPYEADGKWHIMIFDLAAEMPNVIACCQGDDAVDCFLVGTPADETAEFDLAWYGCFQSVEDIEKWDANYNEVHPKDMADK